MNEKANNEVPSCANCFFSESAKADTAMITQAAEGPALFCRRYPPAVVQILTPMGQQAIGSSPPPVRPDHWCGEHEPTHGPLIEH